MPKISFLILTYNSSLYIERLLDSLFEKLGDEIKEGLVEIIIEDNNSSDDTVEIIYDYISDKKAEKIFVAVAKNNNGYAKGINNAAKRANGELLVIINPDAELLEFDSKKILSEFLENPRLAVAGLKIVDFEGKDEKTAGKFFTPLTFLAFSLGLEDRIGLRYSPTTKTKVDFVSGGFVVFRKESFEKLGGYNEEYFMYVEDMDICYRARKLGMEVYFLPYATIRHKGQGSSSREFAIVNIYKGLQAFYNNNASPLSAFYIKNLLSIKAALIIFIGALLGKKELVVTYSKALKTIL